MKRLLLWSIVFVFSLGVTACSSVPKKDLIEISFEEYQAKLENKEDFILYIGSRICPHCQEFKPTLEEVIAKYDLEVFYLDMYLLVEADREISVEENKQTVYLYNTSKTERTPTIVFAKDGVIKLFPRIEGAVSKSVLVDKLKAAGYIE